MFSNPSHYFFNISFDWADILDILEVSKEDQSNLQISEKFEYRSPNAYSDSGIGLNNSSAMFEYYVMPNVLSNAGFNDDSTIFDCQLNRFFSTLNLVYRGVLVNKIDKEKSVSCVLERMAGEDKSIFTVFYSDSILDQKSVSIVFPKECFNRQNANKQWGGIDGVRLFLSRFADEIGEEPEVEEVAPPKSLFLNILLQSEHDASAGPSVHRLVMKKLSK